VMEDVDAENSSFSCLRFEMDLLLDEEEDE
jgi:hypothetical protein